MKSPSRPPRKKNKNKTTYFLCTQDHPKARGERIRKWTRGLKDTCSFSNEALSSLSTWRHSWLKHARFFPTWNSANESKVRENKMLKMKSISFRAFKSVWLHFKHQIQMWSSLGIPIHFKHQFQEKPQSVLILMSSKCDDGLYGSIRCSSWNLISKCKPPTYKLEHSQNTQKHIRSLVWTCEVGPTGRAKIYYMKI